MSRTLISISGSGRSAASPNCGRAGARSSPSRRAKRFIRTVVSLAALALGEAAFSPLHAETDVYGNEIFTYTEGGVTKTYTFWVSGAKAEDAATADSLAASSSATSLETATRSEKSASSSLEARFRTWLESLGRALRSDRFRGFFMRIR